MTITLTALLRAPSAVAVLLALLLGIAVPAGAAESELDQARREANRAAAEVARAQTELAEIELEADAVTTRAVETEARLDQLRAAVRAQAVERFVGGGMVAGTTGLLLQGEDINSAVRAQALARSVTADTDVVLEEYRLASDDLSDARDRLAELEAASAAAVAALDERAEAASGELDRQVRLDAERRAAEAAARKAAERQARAEAAVVADAERLAQQEVRQTVAPRAGQGGAGEPTPTTRPPRTTFTAAPARSAPAPSGDDSFLCPVDGPRAFTNDWGQPRSGGRRHQGTDMLSPRGTPVVASTSGTVRGHQSSLGGVSYYLTGDDGNTYFGTHLDSLSGASGHVSRGTVVGYVGNSGNARGGPTHLHFEIHPGGGAAVNPYPTLAEHC